MPTVIEVIGCFALAAFCWTIIGVSVISLIMPRGLGLALGPSTGWAIHSIVTSIVFRWVEIGRLPVALLLFASTFAGLVLLRRQRKFFEPPFRSHGNAWIVVILGAAGVGSIVTSALYPHFQGDIVGFAGPIFDHSKVTLVDEIAQHGLPAINPLFGEVGQPSTLPYYYLWHFSAASIALTANVSGWAADIAMTWFTAFASLTLLMGLAAWLSQSWVAAGLAAILALTGSIRYFLADLIGYRWAYDLTGQPSGFGAWLFQTTWAPQHVQSAACTMIALLMMGNLPPCRPLLIGLVLAILVAAGFESSAWVGGITFALAALVLGPWLLIVSDPTSRPRLIMAVGIAAILSLAMMFPFISDQFASLSARNAGWPLIISPAEILGDSFPEKYRRIFDIPAFFLLFLPAELCALYLIGVPALLRSWRTGGSQGDRANVLRVLVGTVLVSLLVSGLLRSTLAWNNDLGWRGALPAIMILIVATAAGLTTCWRKMPLLMKGLAVALIVPGLVQGGIQIKSYVVINYFPAGRDFLKSQAMWETVRRFSEPSERIANNPGFVSELTGWPVNISWALLSERRSCFAGGDIAVPLIAKPRPVLFAIDDLFTRVFGGHPEPGDLRDMIFKYDCRVVVVNPRDGAWTDDPFAQSPLFRLVDQREDGWRIYRSVASGAGTSPAR